MNQIRTFFMLLLIMLFSNKIVYSKSNVNHSHWAHAINNSLPKIKNCYRISAILLQQQAKLQQNQAVAARTSSYTSERLIGTSTYNFSDSILYYLGKTDSTYYTYSGSRGSKLNKDAIDFFGVFGQQFNSGDMPLLMSAGLAHTTLNDLYSSDILADSGVLWQSSTLDSTGRFYYVLTDIFTNTYNAANDITDSKEAVLPSFPGDYFNDINTFNSLNNITLNLELMWDGTSWDTVENTFFFYDGSGRLIKDSTNDWSSAGVWQPMTIDDYQYNSAGNLFYADAFNDSVGYWIGANKFYITYNTDNTLHTDSIIENSSGVWVPSIRDSFGYTSGTYYYTYWNEKNYFDDTTIEVIVQNKHIGSTGMPDVIYSSNNLDSMSYPSVNIHNTNKVSITYDSYNNPLLSVQNNFNVTNYTTGSGAYTTTPDYINHWYYEPYLTSSVQTSYISPENVNIYPNPTTNELFISQPTLQPGTRVTLQLINAGGQTVRTESLPWLQPTAKMSLGNIAPGVYWLLVQDAAGGVYKQQVLKE